MIPKIEEYKGNSIDIEMCHHVDITGWDIRCKLYDSNNYAYQELGLSITETALTSSLAQDYKFKVNEVEYTITTTTSMSYANIATLMNAELGLLYDCKIVGLTGAKDIRITHNTQGTDYSISITDGDTANLLTLLGSTPSTAQVALPHSVEKASASVDGGSSSQINWIDTRVAYQDLGLSVDTSTATTALAQLYYFAVNDTEYSITTTESDTYSTIATLMDAVLTSFTVSIEGNSPTQDIRITHDTIGTDYDIEITAGDTGDDLLTLLNSVPDTAISGYTNKGYYTVYIDDDETTNFIGDSFIEIKLTNPAGRSQSIQGAINLKTPHIA